MTSLSVAAAVIPAISCSEDEDGDDSTDEIQTTVFRFQTRKRTACSDCRTYRKHKIFLSRDAADQNRSHTNCNCRIVEQTITEGYSKQITPHAVNGVIDVRNAFNFS